VSSERDEGSTFTSRCRARKTATAAPRLVTSGGSLIEGQESDAEPYRSAPPRQVVRRRQYLVATASVMMYRRRRRQRESPESHVRARASSNHAKQGSKRLKTLKAGTYKLR